MDPVRSTRVRGGERLRAILPSRGGSGLAFDAFISYSHAADGRLAPSLQRAVQRLAKPWYRARALRVFRDESALSANPHLWSSIQTAMDDADWFVLLASPDAVASEWVNRELAHWLANKSPERILVAVTDGTWEWDASARALSGTAVPDALRDAFGDEPRHVDLRWAASETDLDVHNLRFRDVAAQLAAPMHGMAKDDLDSEDVRQHRRARRLARGGVTALTLLVVVSLVATTFAVLQRRDAISQRDVARHLAQVATAERFAVLAKANAAAAEQQALLLGVEAYQRADSPTTRAALLGALAAAPALVGFLPRPHDSTTNAISPDGRLVVAATSGGGLRFWNTDSPGSSVLVASPSELRNERIVAMTFDHVGKRLFALYGTGRVQEWDPLRRRPLGAPITIGTFRAEVIVASADGRTIAVTGVGSAGKGVRGQSVALYDAVAHRSVGHLAATGNAAFSSDGRTLYAWSRNDGVSEFDVRTHRLLGTDRGLNLPGLLLAAATDAQGRRVIAGVGRVGASTGVVLHNAVVLHDADRHREFAVGENLPTAVNAIAMSPTGNTVVLGGVDGTLNVWSWGIPRNAIPRAFLERAPTDARVREIEDTAPLWSVEPPPSQHSAITKISFAADGRRVATTAEDGTTWLWDLSGVGAPATGVPTSNLDRLFALGPTAQVAATGDELRIWSNHPSSGDATHPDIKTALALPASKVTGLCDGRFDDPHRGAQQLDNPEKRNTAIPDFLAFDPTGTKVVAGDTVYAAGAPPRVQRALQGKVVVGASSLSPYAFVIPAPRWRSWMGNGTQGELTAMNIWTGRAIGSLRLSALGDDQLVRKYPIAGTVLRNEGIYQDYFTGCINVGQWVIDPLGRRAATISGKADVIVWDLRTGRPTRAPIAADREHPEATAVAFSPNGAELAVGRVDGSVARYEVPSLRLVGTIAARRATPIGEVAYQPHGSLLAIASADAVDLFDLSSGTGMALASFTNAGFVTGSGFFFGSKTANAPPSGFVQFDASGHHLLTRGYVPDRAALLWSMVPADWVRRACDAAGRNLTRTEWTQLVGNDVPYHRTCAQWPAAK